MIERKFRKTVDCRLDSSGNEITPLDEKSILAHLEFFKENNVNSILIAFLFSYRNNAHENRVLEIVRDQIPSAFVTTSSSVSPQFREFERFTTGAVAAFIGPKVTNYIDNLSLNLKNICQNAELRIDFQWRTGYTRNDNEASRTYLAFGVSCGQMLVYGSHLRKK